MIDDSLFWETLLVQLRGVLIKFAAAEKRKDQKFEQNLIQQISNIEMECNSKNNDQHSLSKLESLNTELIEHRRVKIEGKILRNRAQWVEQGEKSTKFFLQLEKSTYTNKTIKKLEKEDSSCIT